MTLILLPASTADAAEDDCPAERHTTCSYHQWDELTFFGFNSDDDIDWIWMKMSKGVTYTISVNSDQASGERVRGVYDFYGNIALLNPNPAGSRSTMVFTAPLTDYFFIEVHATSVWSAGRYKLVVSDGSVWEPRRESGDAINDDDLPNSTETAGRLSVGGFSVGYLDPHEARYNNVDCCIWWDRDWFKITLQGGGWYNFEVSGRDIRGRREPTQQARFRNIYDSSGTLIRSILSTGFSYGAPETKTIYIEVVFIPTSQSHLRQLVGEEGTYIVAAEQRSPVTGNARTGGRLKPDAKTVSDSVEMKVPDRYDEQWFAIDLVAGENYLFQIFGAFDCGGAVDCGRNQVHARKWALDPVLTGIYANDGSPLEEPGSGSRDNKEYSFLAKKTGKHFISIGNYWRTSGSRTSRGGYYGVRVRVDDYLDNERTLGEITLTNGHGSIGGEIEEEADVDFIRVRLVAGRTYRFDMEGADTGKGTLGNPEIYSLRGPVAGDNCIGFVLNCDRGRIPNTGDRDSGASRNAKFFYIPVQTAVHYIALGPYFEDHRGRRRSGTGSYTVSVTQTDDYTASTNTAGAIIVDDPSGSTGQIRRIADKDWFAVDLLEGYTYTFTVSPLAGVANPLGDPAVGDIRDSSGTSIEGTGEETDAEDGSGVQVSFLATVTGTHYVEVKGEPESDQNEVDGLGFYRVRAQLDTRVDRVPPQETTGTTTDIPHDASSTARVVLHRGSGSSEGNIETSCDVDWIGVTLIGGREYLLEVEGSHTNKGTLRDPELFSVRNRSGYNYNNRERYDDISNTNRNVRMKYRARRTETHFLVVGPSAGVTPGFDPSTQNVSCSGTGTYTVTVTEIDDFDQGTGTNGAVLVDSPAAIGNIENTQDKDWFAVLLSEGNSYRVEVASFGDAATALSDPALAGIHNAGGSLIAGTSNDDRGGGAEPKNARFFFSATENGTHFLSVEGSSETSDNTGFYSVTVVRDDYSDDPGFPAQGSFVNGVSRTGAETERHRDVDWHSVTLAANHRYSAMATGDSDSGRALKTPRILGVYTGEGDLVAGTGLADRTATPAGACSEAGPSTAESLVCFVVDQDGTYYVAASGGEQARNPRRLTGHYAVVVQDIDPPVVNAVELTSDPGPDNRYDAGDVIDVTVTFGEEVVLAGTASLDLVIGPRVRSAETTSPGMEADASLAFRYTVQTDDLDTDGVSIPSGELRLEDQATIQDLAMNDALLDFSGVSDQSGHNVGDPQTALTDDFAAGTNTSGRVPTDGTAANGSIEEVGDSDWFRVTLTAGTSYRFDVASLGGESSGLQDPELTGIYRASGTLVSGTSNDDRDSSSGHPRSYYTPASGGRYFVGVGGASKTPGNTGIYSLTVVRDDHPDDTSTAGAVSVDDIAPNNDGEIEVQGDVDWHRVALETSHTYAASVVGYSGDGRSPLRSPQMVGIYNSEGNLVPGTGRPDRSGARQADCSMAAASTVASLECFTVDSPGDYYVAVSGPLRASNPRRLIGHYDVVVRDTDTPMVTAVEIISDPGDNLFYDPGERITVTVRFNEAITVTGNPRLELTIGTRTVSVSDVRGLGSDALLFFHTVVAGEIDADGVSIPENALKLLSDVTIRDQVDHDANTYFPALGDQADHPVGRTAVLHVEFGSSAYAAAEGGDETTVTVSLSRDPGRAVTVPLQLTGVNGATLHDWTAPTAVQFGPGELSKTISVTAVDDDIDDDGESLDISFGAMPQGVTAGPVSRTRVSFTDDDARGVSVNLISLVVQLNVNESYSVSLLSRPTAAVTVTVTAAGVTVSPTELAFPPEKWSLPQMVTVTASKVGAGSVTHSATGGDYQSEEVTIPVTVSDTRQTVTLGSELYRATEGGDNATVDVFLSFEPVAPVMIPLVMSGMGADSGDWAAPTSVEFGPGESAKTVDIQAVDDDIDDDGESVQVSLGTLPETVVRGERSEATVLLIDNDTRGLKLSETMLNVPVDGDAVTYSLALASKPTASVTVTITAPSGVSASPDEVSFAASTWNIPQNVEVTATAAGPGSIGHSASGGDYGSQSADINIVAVTAVAGPRVTGLTLTSDAGTDARYGTGDAIEVNVAFDRTVTLVGTAWLELDIGTSTGNASYQQGSGTTELVFSYTVTTNDADGNGVSIAADALKLNEDSTIRDDDANDAQLRLAAVRDQSDHRVGVTDPSRVAFSSALYLAAEGGDDAQVTVTVSPALPSPVAIEIVASGDNGAEPEDWEAATTVNFAAGQTSRTVPVRAVDDDIDEDDPSLLEEEQDSFETSERVRLYLSDLPESVAKGDIHETAVVLFDNDVRSVALSVESLNVAVGGGGSRYQVTLGSRPTENVTIDISSVVADANPTRLIFLPDQWNRAQEVTATATSAGTGTVVHSASGGDYEGVAEILATTAENSEITVSFGETSYQAFEGGSSAAVVVTLNRAPSSSLTIPIEAVPNGGAGEGDYTVPTELNLQRGQTSRTLYITAVDDGDDDDGESVILSFGTLPEGVVAGARSESVVTLVDDEGSVPLLVSATLRSDELELTYDRELDPDSKPSYEAYYVTLDGRWSVAYDIRINGSTVSMVLDVPAGPGETVKVSYTPPTDGPVLRGARLTPASALVEHSVRLLAPTVGDARKGICARTPEIRNGIVVTARTRHTWVADCTEITPAHLAEIEKMYLPHENIHTVRPGDFHGLANLVYLQMSFNSISHLPSGVFSGLTSLLELDLSFNQLTDVDSLRERILSEVPTLTSDKLRLSNQS